MRVIIGSKLFDSEAGAGKVDLIREWKDGTEKLEMVDGEEKRVPDPKDCQLFKTNLGIWFMIRDEELVEVDERQAMSFIARAISNKEMSLEDAILKIGDKLQKTWKEDE